MIARNNHLGVPPSWRARARLIATNWLAAWPTLTLILLLTRPLTAGWPIPPAPF